MPCLPAFRWLAAHGRLEQAQAILRSLRSPEEADADVADLGELTRAEKARPRQALAALLQEPEVQAELRLGERACAPALNLRQHEVQATLKSFE